MKEFEIEYEIVLENTEDGGDALIAESIEFPNNLPEGSGMFLTLTSYDETKKHKDFISLLNKKVKITIEII